MNMTHNIGWTITLSIFLMMLGVITLSAQFFANYISLMFLGWVLLVGGVIEFSYGFFSGNIGRAFAFFVGGIFSVVTGALVVTIFGLSPETVTLLIGMCMLSIGIYNTFSTIIIRYSNWGWVFAGGFLTLLFGLITIVQWPASGEWLLSLFVGIQLFVSGFLLMVDVFNPSEDEGSFFQDSVYFE